MCTLTLLLLLIHTTFYTSERCKNIEQKTGSNLIIGTALVSGLNLCEFLVSHLHRSSTAAAGWEKKKKKNHNDTPICGLIEVFE